jgi:hypothetical protein
MDPSHSNVTIHGGEGDLELLQDLVFPRVLLERAFFFRKII